MFNFKPVSSEHSELKAQKTTLDNSSVVYVSGTSKTMTLIPAYYADPREIELEKVAVLGYN